MNPLAKDPADRGMTLLEVIIVLSIIGILVTIVMPTFNRPRERVQASLCTSNLRQLRDAKQIWSIDHNKAVDDTPTPEDLAPYLRTGTQLKCPSIRGPAPYMTEHYEIGTVEEEPQCRIVPETHLLSP